MNKLQIFKNENFGEIRMVEVKGKVYFVAKDVATALGYKDTINAIKQHCKGVVKRHILTNGGKQLMNVIPEGDIYRLVAHSELPSAEKFESWVFDEVLPTIRKTGAYSIPNITPTRKPCTRMRKVSTAVKDVEETAKLISKMFAVPECMALTKAVGLVEDIYEISLDSIRQLIKPAQHVTGFLTPTEIGMKLGGKKAGTINTMLCDLHLQIQEVGAKGKKLWRLTDTGRNYGEEFPYDAKSGHSGYQIKWNENVISLLEVEEGAAQ